jgi:hypothetical protein
MINYLKESHKKSQDRKEYMLFDVPVYVINKFPSNIKVNNILSFVKNIININYLNGLEAIYIGDFDDLNRRNIQSMFKDGAFWISSNNIKNFITEPIVAENIIHEVAHLLEERFPNLIYGDGRLEKEYNSKKERLYQLLKKEKYNKINYPLFFDDDQLKELDHFLYNLVGYDKVSLLTSGLFLSPYSIITIREYFATGFLHFLLEDVNYLKDVSPILFEKVTDLIGKLNNEI